MPTLRFRFLGPIELHWETRPLPKPATRKAQSLLAYLVTHRDRPQPRDKLADLYWGEWPERKARRSLTTALWRIRRCLPDDALLQADVDAVQFVPPADFWLDVDDFVVKSHTQWAAPIPNSKPQVGVWSLELGVLRDAVALYRGDFLAGFYDDWIVTERFRLEALLGEALARLMVAFEQRGEHQAALATALRLLEHSPLQEDAHRLVMRAYCRLGHRHQALEQYRRCQEALQQELGVAATAETAELYQAIRAGRFPLDPVEATPVPVPAAVRPAVPTGHSPLDAVAPAPLVGREPELAFLHQRWSAALAGPGGLALVGGEAGVGKTRLVEEFARQVGWQGARVLWGRCYEFERLLPYQPVAEALRPLDPADLTDLPAATVAEVTRLVPEIRVLHPSIEVSEAPPDQERTRLFEGLTRLLAALSAREPLLLVLEDLHWATGSTLQLLHYLTRHLTDCPALLVGTCRTELTRPDHPLRALQHQLEREGLSSALDLARLSPAATTELVLALSGAGDAARPLARRLHQETAGNPFFLMETLKALFAADTLRLEEGAWQGDWSRLGAAELPLPASVSVTIQERVLRLSADAQALLPRAAVAGREFDLDLLQALWGRDMDATLETLDELLRHRLVDEGTGALGRDYAFTHHKIQEVVYAGLPRRRRQHLHARAGAALEAVYAAEVSEVAGELAFHFQQARQLAPSLTEKAIAYLLQAGDQAHRQYAFPEAVDYYQRALALLQEAGDLDRAARTLLKLGLTHHSAFDFRQARQAYEQGFALWQRAEIARRERAESSPPAPHALRVVDGSSEALSLDPALEDASIVIDQVFSGLVEWAVEGSVVPDVARHEGSVVPDVARNWEVLDGGRRYVFHLRDDVRWSDGVPVTAQDFCYAWKRLLTPATGSPFAYLLYDIQGAQAFHQGRVSDPDSVGVRAPDEGTLVVELEGPTGYFLRLLIQAAWYPVPRHVVEAHGAAWTEAAHIVTNGPFRLEARRRGESTVLVRNPGHHGRFPGNVERIELRFAPEGAACLALYDADEVDVAFLPGTSPVQGERARQRYAGEQISTLPVGTHYIGFDVRQPPFDDRRVRQALALATDRERLVDVVLRGHDAPATGGFVPPGLPGHSPGIALPYDPARARRLLAEAGYPDGRGFPAVDALGYATPFTSPLIEDLQAQWRDNLGVAIQWQIIDWPALLARLDDEPPHMFQLSWVGDYPDPDSFLRVYFIQRRTQWRDEAYEELVEHARRITDQDQRMRLYAQAERILVEQAPIIPLVYRRHHYLIKPWVQFPGAASGLWSWRNVVIEPH